MIKVIIADMDTDNCKNFRTFIKAARQEFSVTRTLSTQVDIESALADTQLLIADIKYFGSSGYQQIKRIHQQLPDLCIILYGTYDDTEYMERSVDSGVISFMYKPVKPKDLNRSLLKAKQAIEEMAADKTRKNQLIASYDAAGPVFEDRFLINLIHGHIELEREAAESFQYYGFHLESPYRAVVVKVNHYRQLSLAYTQQEKQLLIYSILNVIQQRLAQMNNGLAFINHFNTITFIIGNGYSFGELIKLCEEFKDLIKRDIKTSVTIGIGRSVEKAVEIAISYKQAKSALRYRYFMGEGAVIPIDYMEPENNVTYHYPLKKEELLVYSAVVGDFNKAQNCLDLIFNALREINEQSEIPSRLLSKIVTDIALSIDRYEMEQNTTHQNLFSRYFSVKDTMKLTTIDNFYTYFKEVLANYCSAIGKARKERELQLIGRVKRHVDEHFFENISLSEMAMNSGCVPEYLNKLFFESEGRSYYDYVVSVRMKAAKKLLERQNVDDATIAVSVGYENDRYFRGIFQRYEGITPDEYRDMYMRGVIE